MHKCAAVGYTTVGFWCSKDGPKMFTSFFKSSFLMCSIIRLPTVAADSCSDLEIAQVVSVVPAALQGFEAGNAGRSRKTRSISFDAL